MSFAFGTVDPIYIYGAVPDELIVYSTLSENCNFMLNLIKSELSKRSFRLFCQENEHFAVGVIQNLLDTEFCIFGPNRANKFSQMAFKFPTNVHEELLECILDSVELLSGKPANLAIASEASEFDGYVLGIKNSTLIDKIMQKYQEENPWHLAGIIFIQVNKNKTIDNEISIIDSKLFGRNNLDIVSKFNYLLL